MRRFCLLLFFLACAPAPLPPAAAPADIAKLTALRRRPEVSEAISEISAAMAKGHVEKLVSFGTRHTLSDTSSKTRGIGAARTWIKSELERYASGRSGELAMQVAFDAHTQPADGARIPREAEIVNVVAVLPGAMPEARARRYYVVGHY